MAITVNGSVIIDETTGAQNDGASGGDITGNELASTGLPPAFDLALTAIAGAPPSTAALSGFSTTTPTGVNVLDYGGAAVSGVAFVDVNGDPMDGVDSGLLTTDGTKIFLYTYLDDNNVLFGVKADSNGDPVDPEDPSNPDIVFAAYLEEGAAGAKVWMVQYEPLFHLDDTDFDDPVSPDDVIFVAVSELKTFSLAGAPSGQNLFLMYGDAGDGIASNGIGDDAVALVVTAKNAGAGGSVNTGQGGGGTTLGSNNQMIDPGEALVFTFVTDANSNFTVPNLDQNEADVASNIQFVGVFGSPQASFKVVQTQPASKAGTLTISAFTTAAESGGAYIPGLTGDSPVAVTSVLVKNAAGTVIEASDGSVDTANLSISISGGGIATVTGVKAGYTIEYTTAGNHNRVHIDNIGNSNAKLNADFDIGDFSLPTTAVTNVLLDALVFEDDGPAATGTAQTDAVDEDGLTGGNPGGPGDLAVDNLDGDNNEATNSGNVSAIFSGGADGLASFGLSNDPADIALLPTLTSKGGTVAYDVTATTLTAYVDDGTTAGYQAAQDREVFTLALTAASGAYTFTLLDQLDHSIEDDPGTVAIETAFEDDIALQLGAILQATDGDGDTVTASADKLVITVDDDSPDALTPGDITVHNAPGGFAEAALGYFGQVGADEDGTVQFTGGTDGDILQGTIQDGTPVLENLLFGGLPIRLYGFGTGTLIGTTDNTDPTATVFTMTLNPDGTVLVDDVYDITMHKTIANTQDVEFGAFAAHVASGNPLTLVVNNIGGTTIDALFSGFVDRSNATTTQTTVNVSQAGVGVGTGQDFDFDPQTASATDNLSDRLRIQFLEDDGDGVLETGEAETINRFTLVMNQNNSPADDGDALIRVYDASGTELQITGILVNGSTLVGSGGAPVPSNDGTTVTAVASGLGYELHGLGGGTGGSNSDNDTVTIITADGYTRIDISAIGNDANKDTFDILLKSIAVPVSFDIDFSVQASLTDEDGDTSAAANLDVSLDADGVFVTTVGTSGLVEPIV
jgi:hypothetical protein